MVLRGASTTVTHLSLSETDGRRRAAMVDAIDHFRGTERGVTYPHSRGANPAATFPGTYSSTRRDETLPAAPRGHSSKGNTATTSPTPGLDATTRCKILPRVPITLMLTRGVSREASEHYFHSESDYFGRQAGRSHRKLASMDSARP